MPSICAECKRQKGKTCCEVWVGEKPTMPLSLSEVQRIAKATGKAPKEFMEVDQVDQWEIMEHVVLAPVAKALHTGDARVRLKTVPVEGRRDLEACVFLGPQGCTLTKATRPYGCRLYPFVYNAGLAKSESGGLVRFPTGITCLATEESPTDDARLAASLGTNKRELVLLGVGQEADAEQHKKLMTKR